MKKTCRSKPRARSYPKPSRFTNIKKRGKIKPAFSIGMRGAAWKYSGTGI